MKRLLFFTLLLFFFTIGCKKGGDNKPIGDYCICKINGKAWKAECNSMFSNCLKAQWTNNRKDFLISCSNSSSQYIYIGLYDSIGLQSGRFILDKYQRSNSGNYRDYVKSYKYYYSTNSLNVGVVSIVFDEKNSRVNGTFSFKAQYETDSEVVNITAGEFSLRCDIY